MLFETTIILSAIRAHSFEVFILTGGRSKISPSLGAGRLCPSTRSVVTTFSGTYLLALPFISYPIKSSFTQPFPAAAAAAGGHSDHAAATGVSAPLW